MPVYSLTAPPPVTSLFVTGSYNNTGSVVTNTGFWQTLQIVSASSFAVLSGSMGNFVNPGFIFPSNTILQGQFVAFAVLTGSVIAHNADIY